MKKILFYLLLLSVAACTTNESTDIQTNANHQVSLLGMMENVSAEDVVKLLKYDKNVMIFDVSKPNPDAKECKLLGNIMHLDKQSIFDDPDIVPSDVTVVLISKKGQESVAVAQFLISKKKITIYNLKGGMEAYWKWREKLIREKLNIYEEEINVLDLYSQDFGC